MQKDVASSQRNTSIEQREKKVGKQKQRRSRTNFSELQLAELERLFCEVHYPSEQVKRDIALKLGVASDRITVRKRSSLYSSTVLPESDMDVGHGVLLA